VRVLHLTAGNLYGGVETYLVTLARCRHLCPEMEPEFALCFPGRLRDELTAAGVPVHDLGPVRVSRPWTVLRARRRVGRLAATRGFDVAVCHMSWVLGLLGGPAARHRVPVVAYMHGPGGGGWVDWVGNRQLPALLVGPSEHTVGQWRPGFPGVTARVLNYPIPPHVLSAPDPTPADRAAVRTELGAGPDDAVILQACRIERWKGPDLVIRALAGLRDLPAWRFWLAGGVQKSDERAYYGRLQGLAVEAGIGDRVAFLGQRSDVPALLGAADIYCQGNRGPEGFSLSFLEASYRRLPVVTTDLGGAGEMVDASTGVLVPASEDPDRLAEALRGLITDPAARARLGEAARAKALRLSDPAQQLGRLAGYLNEAVRPVAA
jgi:glycosyltransferase involved in cell wall biosynthesis